jgi:hypothetical protein
VNTDKSLIDLLKEEYLSQLTGVVPLSRLALSLICLVVVVKSKEVRFTGVTQSLLDTRLRMFGDMEYGIFSAVTIRDLIVALAMVFTGFVLHVLARNGLFAVLKRQIRLSQIVADMSAKSAETEKASMQGYVLAKRSESESAKWGKRISSLSSASECAMTLSVAFCFAAFVGSGLDIAVAALSFLLAVMIELRSFVVFLRSYLPHAAHLRGQLGTLGDVPLP